MKKININLINVKYYVSFALLLSIFLTGSIADKYFGNSIIRFFICLISVSLLILNKDKLRMNYEISKYTIYLGLIVILLVVLRNDNLKYGFDNNIFFYSLMLILTMILFHDDCWGPIFLKVVMYYCFIHIVITIVCYFMPTNFSLIVSQYLLTNLQYDVAKEYILSDRITGITSHYSVNATYIALGVGILGTKLISESKENKKNTDYIFFLLGLFALVVVGKRAHLILTILILIFIWLFQNKQNLSRRIFKLSIYITIFIGLFYIFLPIFASNLSVVNRLTDSQDLDSLGGRLPLFEEAIRLFKEHPLFGGGWGSYPNAVQYTVGQFYTEINSKMMAHNIYLQLLVEVGIVGFVCFLILFLIPLKQNFKLIKFKIGSLKLRWQILASLYIQLFFIFYGLTGNPLYDRSNYIPYFLSCILIISINYRVSNFSNKGE